MVVDTARPAAGPPERRYLWTDDSSSILPVLK
jgi:hypothetical protein